MSAPRLEPGVGVPELRQVISQERINDYAAASGDHNPIHLDPKAAAAAGLPSTIAHGLLTMGATCANLERWLGGSRFVGRVSCRFSAPLPSGSELSCTGQVAGLDDAGASITLEARDGDGRPVLTRAQAIVREF